MAELVRVAGVAPALVVAARGAWGTRPLYLRIGDLDVALPSGGLDVEATVISFRNVFLCARSGALLVLGGVPVGPPGSCAAVLAPQPAPSV